MNNLDSAVVDFSGLWATLRVFSQNQTVRRIDLSPYLRHFD